MRLTQAVFWATVLAVFAIGASAGTDVISNHQAVNQVIFAASSIGLAGLILNQIWPQPLEAAVGLVRHRFPSRRGDPFIPLSQAARELYEGNLDNWLGEAARGDAGNGSNPLLWCAYHVRDRLPEIYGRRPPSTVLERIPPKLFNRLHFDDAVTRLSDGSRTNYVDLAVKRDAFRATLAVLTDHDRPSSN